MATTINLTRQTLGICHVDDVPEASIRKVNELLQLNHDRWHTIWRMPGGLHNHQVHYLLTDLSLGATPEQVQLAFDSNADYQRPIETGDERREVVISHQNFDECLGIQENYAAWLIFFELEVERKGWKEALDEYLFSDTSRANDLFGRLYEGAIHPIIHLGFAVEYEQPSIVAEALAQTAIHGADASQGLLRVEKLARLRTNDQHSALGHARSICDLYMAIHADLSIRNAECWKGGTYERNGNFWEVIPQNLVDIAASYKIHSPTSESLDRAVAEMINASAWLAAAPQRISKEAKIDFFFMHIVNCSIFLSVFAKASWLSLESKARLLEFKVRTDLVLFANQGSPHLRTDAIINYIPRQPECTSWTDIIDRAKKIPCDGHVVKMIRALRHGSIISRPYEDAEKTSRTFMIKGNMWTQIANMVLDTTEDYPNVLDKWMRGPGFDRAWDAVPDKVKTKSASRQCDRSERVREDEQGFSS